MQLRVLLILPNSLAPFLAFYRAVVGSTHGAEVACTLISHT